MSPRSIYRAAVPDAGRKALWHLRRAVACRLAGRPSREARGEGAGVRLALGFPRARAVVDGNTFFVDLRDDGVGRHLFVERSYEPAETAFLRRALGPGMTVVDVGANIGYYTALASRSVGAAGRVLAIEPDPYNFGLLERAVAANRLGNVSLMNVGLGSGAGTARLFRSGQNYGDHRMYDESGPPRDSVEVRIETLDAIAARVRLGRVDLIKIDVQGYEHAVLRGMLGTLGSAGAMTILTEFWPHGIGQAGGSPSAYLETFFSLGFTASVLLDGGARRPVDPGEIMALIPEHDADRPDLSYVNLVLERPGTGGVRP